MTRTGPRRKPNIDERIDAVDKLHSYPPIVQKILSVISDEDFDIRRVVGYIKRDPALAASILRLVNSSHFGLANKVSGVQHAVTYLGRRTLRIAVLSFGLVDRLMEATPAVLFEVYWRRALTMACAARLCAKGVNEDEDTAYCAGLFADLGVLVFAQTDPSGYPSLYLNHLHSIDLIDAEREVFGYDHAAVTARLLSRWKFPANIVDAVADYQSYRPGRDILVQSIHAASLLAELLWTSDSQQLPALQCVLRDEFDREIDDLISLAYHCETEFLESAELFHIDVPGGINVETIRRDAQRLLTDTAVERLGKKEPEIGPSAV